MLIHNLHIEWEPGHGREVERLYLYSDYSPVCSLVEGRYSPLQVIDADVVRTGNIANVDFGSDRPIDQPEMPQNESLLVYSQTAAELNGTAFNGGLSIVGTDIGGYNASYQDLEILAGDNPTYITGEVSSSIGRGLNFTSLTYTDFNYSVIGNLIDEDGLDTSVVLNQEVTDSIFSEVRNTLTTNFSVIAPWTRGESVEVVTTEQFTGADLGEGNFLTGELTVLSTSGDSVIVSADTGSAESWSASVNVGDDNFTVDGTWAETGMRTLSSVSNNFPTTCATSIHNLITHTMMSFTFKRCGAGSTYCFPKVWTATPKRLIFLRVRWNVGAYATVL